MPKFIKKRAKSLKASIPYAMLIEEGIISAEFIRKYFEPENARPGLRLAGDAISLKSADELLALCAEASRAQVEYLKQSRSEKRANPGDAVARGRQWIRDMRHMLKWMFRDNSDVRAGKWTAESMADFLRTPESKAGDCAHNATVIAGYLSMTRGFSRVLLPEWGYTNAFVAEGKWLAAHLSTVRRGRPAASAGVVALYEKRQQLMTEILERIRTVRSAARFVFRNHPEIIREGTSAYERRRRSRSRKAR